MIAFYLNTIIVGWVKRSATQQELSVKYVGFRASTQPTGDRWVKKTENAAYLGIFSLIFCLISSNFFVV